MRGRGRRWERLVPPHTPPPCAIDGRADLQQGGGGYQNSEARSEGLSLALAETCSSALLAALLGWIPSDRPQGLAECTNMHGVQQRKREEGQGTAGLKVGSCIKKNTQPPASRNRLNLSWVPTHLPLPRNRSWLALAGWPSYLPSLSLISLIHLRLCMSVRVHVNTIMGSERTERE